MRNYDNDCVYDDDDDDDSRDYDDEGDDGNDYNEDFDEDSIDGDYNDDDYDEYDDGDDGNYENYDIDNDDDDDDGNDSDLLSLLPPDSLAVCRHPCAPSQGCVPINKMSSSSLKSSPPPAPLPSILAKAASNCHRHH